MSLGVGRFQKVHNFDTFLVVYEKISSSNQVTAGRRLISNVNQVAAG